MRLILMPRVMEITPKVRERFRTKPLDLSVSAHAYTEWLRAGNDVPKGHLDWDFGISAGWLWVKYLACDGACCPAGKGVEMPVSAIH
jgi:hypothetical protein